MSRRIRLEMTYAEASALLVLSEEAEPDTLAANWARAEAGRRGLDKLRSAVYAAEASSDRNPVQAKPDGTVPN